MSKLPIPSKEWLLEQCGWNYDSLYGWTHGEKNVSDKAIWEIDLSMQDLWEACKAADENKNVVIRENSVMIESDFDASRTVFWTSDYGSITAALSAALGWLKGWEEAAYVARAKKYGPKLAEKMKEVINKEADHENPISAS